ncbi:hypothetical protein HK096_010013, partial [Nowakowskiella sp. JEL0078]
MNKLDIIQPRELLAIDTKLSNGIQELEEQQRVLSSYQELPLDLSLAKMQIEQKKIELRNLERTDAKEKRYDVSCSTELGLIS